MGVIPVALTIAGSDPSGGAGVQADLKTFSALGVYGMSVVTAITAQNTLGIREVFDIPAASTSAQIDAVVSDIAPMAVKVGMLSSAANVRAVGERLLAHQVETIVVDPIIRSTSGEVLLEPSALEQVRQTILPMTFLLTPNLDEAEALLGTEVRTRPQMEEAAVRLHSMGVRHVLVTGGHLAGDLVADMFFDGHRSLLLEAARIATRDSHGSGCVLSAAITGYLARGFAVEAAVSSARAFTRDAIQNGLRLGHGAGPCNPLGL